MTKYGQSSLTESIVSNNSKLAELLVKANADLFFGSEDLRELSPFYQAIKYER